VPDPRADGTAGRIPEAERLPGRLGKLLPALVYLALFSNARFFLERTSGMLTLLLAAVLLISGILLAGEVLERLARVAGRPIRAGSLRPAALAAAGVMAAVLCVEGGLQLLGWWGGSSDGGAARAGLVIPAEWARRPEEVPGASLAYRWHGILHVHNADGMRRIGPFPPKRADRFRIAVLGDSLTYGYGVEASEAYPSLLEQELAREYRVEVLNLGVSGAQSQDLLARLRTVLPQLAPDLVLYGVCLNDFLPSGVGQYPSNRAYALPLPYRDHFVAATLTGRLLEKQYDILLMRLGVRDDFLGDILKDFRQYQSRFARDVRGMSALLAERGLPPLVAMVLQQYPDTRGKSYQVVLAAERHLEAAGVRLIPSEYIRQNDRRTDWYVSPWEGHPNAKAHRAFALEFAGTLRRLPALQGFQGAAPPR